MMTPMPSSLPWTKRAWTKRAVRGLGAHTPCPILTPGPPSAGSFDPTLGSPSRCSIDGGGPAMRLRGLSGLMLMLLGAAACTGAEIDGAATSATSTPAAEEGGREGVELPGPRPKGKPPPHA